MAVEPGAKFVDLKSELYARGYDHLDQDDASRARAGRMINQAYLELALEDQWPFRRRSVYGAPPLEIADLDDIISVSDTTNSNRPLEMLTIDEWGAYIDGTVLGSPIYYFDAGGTIYVYPSGGSLLVKYYAVPSYLVSDNDTTWVPLRYMDVIVDGAVRRAAKDRDNPDAAAFAEEERLRGLALMRRQLLTAPTRMELSGGNLDD